MVYQLETKFLRRWLLRVLQIQLPLWGFGGPKSWTAKVSPLFCVQSGILGVVNTCKLRVCWSPLWICRCRGWGLSSLIWEALFIDLQAWSSFSWIPTAFKRFSTFSTSTWSFLLASLYPPDSETSKPLLVRVLASSSRLCHTKIIATDISSDLGMCFF